MAGPSGRKILAVEDDAASRRILVTALDALGYGVIQAENGARALEIFERETPPIVAWN